VRPRAPKTTPAHPNEKTNGYNCKVCDECYSSRKEKSSAENESSALDDVSATVREQNLNR
jgi:hypothetical protein